MTTVEADDIYSLVIRKGNPCIVVRRSKQAINWIRVPELSLSIRGYVQNISSENEFYFQENKTSNIIALDPWLWNRGLGWLGDGHGPILL